MKTENITKYTCDACLKSEYVGKDKVRPMQEYKLPMKYYDETGKNTGLTKGYVDLCGDCAAVLEQILSKYYDIASTAYLGVSMKWRANDD